MTEIDLLLSNMDAAYGRAGWHGPNLRGSVRGVTAREAAWRPSEGRHNIWELAVHAAYWKYAVWRRVTGEKRGSFALKGSNWFERPEVPTESAWKQDRELLDGQHRLLREAVALLTPARLRQRPKGSRYPVAALVYGAAAHDVYHAGQIQLLKVLQRKRDAR